MAVNDWQNNIKKHESEKSAPNFVGGGQGYDYEVGNFISWKFFAISYYLNQKMVQSSH